MVYEENRGVLKSILENVVSDAVTYTEHVKRKRVTTSYVVNVLKRQRRTLYEFGDRDGPQRKRDRRGSRR